MDYLKLSKEVSYVLRHAPWEYELELDNEGWVSIAQLIDVLKENSHWENVNEDALINMIESSDKKRHEIVNGKIRALYGHSTPNKINKIPMEPPEVLYHGTAKRFMSSIVENGLLPQTRQYVHLSIDKETAMQVGKRRDNNPMLLVVNSRKAYEDGIVFYHGNDKVWLADSIPSKYITQI